MTRDITFRTVRPRPDARRGVALLIVVGLLGLLLISSVAFSIMMRTERSGASNFHHATAARQMLQTALARAIEDIGSSHPAEFDTGASEAPANRGDNQRVSVGNRSYPAWTHDTWEIWDPLNPNDPDYMRIITGIRPDVLFSVDENVLTNEIYRARVLSMRALWMVPQALREAVETAQPEWIPVEVNGRNVGRYAYVAANVSGLLDANVVNDPLTNRWIGGSAGEIRLARGVQIDVVNTNLFMTDRQQRDGRYATLDELVALNRGLTNSVLSNFDVFSYAPAEDLPDSVSPQQRALLGGGKVCIGGDANSIRSRRSAITNAFRLCGLDYEQSQWCYLGLVDYVDDNVTPEGIDDTEKLARPCTEPVPLFSQANMAIAYTPGPAVAGSRTYTIQYTFQACFVYPYRQTGSDFTIEADAVVLNNNTDPQWQPLIPDPHFTVDNTFPFSPDTFEFIEAEPQVMTVTAPVAVGAPLLDLDIVITARTLKDGVVVRQTPASDYEDENEKVHVRLNLQLPATLPAGMTTTSLNFWAEAIDPRFNWVGDGADGKYWRSSVEPGAVDNGQTEVASPNAPLEMLKTFAAFTGYVPYYDPNPISSLNAYMLTHPKALSDYFNIVVDGVRDGDANAAHCDPLTLQARAHVANRPLQSVGELGYLPIARWQTLSLYDHGHDNNRNLQPASGYHPVLDYFTLMASNTPPRRGRVNLNTSVTGALAAVFNDLPLLTENPSTPTIPRVRMNGDSMVLANLVRRKGPFTNLSELGKIWNKPDVDQLGVFAQGNLPAANNPLYYIAQTCGAPGFGEFEREAAIRNTCNLLTTRQQIYTIILRADSFVPRYAMTHIREGNVLATAQAVAQIWRDPVATDCGGVMKHKCFVQLFKLIDE